MLTVIFGDSTKKMIFTINAVLAQGIFQISEIF
jgi:hypothetical protein